MRAVASVAGAVLALGGWAPACAFPTVAYDDSLCEGLPRCPAGSCGDDARIARDDCAAECLGGNPPCLASCDAVLEEALGACIDACLVCADESGCGSYAAQCEALVGSG